MDITIINILKEIDKHGFEAYIVGGYVRDNLMCKASFDVDICTSARPRDLLDIFGGNVELVLEYGAVKLIKDKYKIDITTFRKEEKYVDGKPKGIIYVDNLETDLKRRDFTINTICLDKDVNIIDLLNGRKDLKDKIIRTVGKAKIRFKEDPSRILRALRFASTLDFKLDDEIIEYIINNKKEIENINYNKKKYELDKILLSDNVFEFVKLVKKLDIEKELGIKFKKLVPLKSLVGMWAQIDFNSKFPFTKIEMEQINDIKSLVKKGSVNKFDVYKYGNYIATTAGSILGKNSKKINKLYEKLPIKDIIDIDIEANEICEILNISPSKQLGDIYKILEYEIIEGKLQNKKEIIIKRLKKYKGE